MMRHVENRRIRRNNMTLLHSEGVPVAKVLSDVFCDERIVCPQHPEDFSGGNVVHNSSLKIVLEIANGFATWGIASSRFRIIRIGSLRAYQSEPTDFFTVEARRWGRDKDSKAEMRLKLKRKLKGYLVATKFKLRSKFVKLPSPHPQPLSQWERVAG